MVGGHAKLATVLHLCVAAGLLEAHSRIGGVGEREWTGRLVEAGSARLRGEPRGGETGGEACAGETLPHRFLTTGLAVTVVPSFHHVHHACRGGTAKTLSHLLRSSPCR